MTRMMKIVPARRVVTEASPEPPNIDRSRAITPAGGTVADCASITATAENPSAPHGAAIIRPINHSLRFGWVNLSFRGARKREPGISRFRVHAPHAPEWHWLPLLQIDIEFVSGVRAGRQPVEFE